MAHPYLEGGGGTRILAHRGFVTPELAASGAVENSLAAVRAAAELGAGYVESDCQVTRDGAVVLFHDANLRRLTGDPRAVAEVTERELRALMLERGGLLTLEEALSEFGETRFNIDVKAPEAALPAGAILAPHADRVLATSFDDRIRRRALRSAERARRGSGPLATAPGRTALALVLAAVASRSDRAASRALRGLDALQVPERYLGVPVLTGRLIDVAHRHGVEVHVWTINDPLRMRQLVELGVDGVVTDRAELAIEALR